MTLRGLAKNALSYLRPNEKNINLKITRSAAESMVADDEKLVESHAQLLAALEEAENALADYIPALERTGASLNYGHSVLRKARAAIASAKGTA